MEIDDEGVNSLTQKGFEPAKIGLYGFGKFRICTEDVRIVEKERGGKTFLCFARPLTSGHLVRLFRVRIKKGCFFLMFLTGNFFRAEDELKKGGGRGSKHESSNTREMKVFVVRNET